VQSCLEGYEEKHQVGPLALYFMLMEIAFCNTKTINLLSAALAKIKLALFNNAYNNAVHTITYPFNVLP